MVEDQHSAEQLASARKELERRRRLRKRFKWVRKTYFRVIVGGLVVFLLVWAYRAFAGSADLVINANVLTTTEVAKVKIVGSVEIDGAPVEGAQVWLQAFDKSDTNVPLDLDIQITESTGFFGIEIPTTVEEYPPIEIIKVRAQQKRWVAKNRRAEYFLGIAPDSTEKAVTKNSEKRSVVNSTVGAFILGLFIVSILVALMWSPSTERLLRYKYNGIVLLAILFPLVVAGAFGVAQSRLVTAANEKKILSLGVATVFKATYVKDVPEEWLISMTLSETVHDEAPGSESKVAVSAVPAPATVPKPALEGAGDAAGGAAGAGPGAGAGTGVISAVGAAAASDAGGGGGAKGEEPKSKTDAKDMGKQDVVLVKGFGAPLWVLFLSVIGAGLSMISLIVREIADPPNFDPNNTAARTQLRSRLQVLVEHEFYILFAPIGGAFVYQLMVLSKAANEPATVAIAALGAGMSINAILSRAVKASSRVVKGEEKHAAAAAADNAAAEKTAAAEAAAKKTAADNAAADKAAADKAAADKAAADNAAADKAAADKAAADKAAADKAAADKAAADKAAADKAAADNAAADKAAADKAAADKAAADKAAAG